METPQSAQERIPVGGVDGASGECLSVRWSDGAFPAALRRSLAKADLEELPARFLQEAVAASGAVGAALFARTGTESFRPVAVVEEGELLPELVWRAEPLFAGFEETCALQPGFLANMRWGRSVILPVAAEAGFWPEALAYHRQRGHRQVWQVPIRLEGKTVGFLGLACREARRPDASCTAAVEAIAFQAALALRTAEVSEHARDAAVAREREKAAGERVAALTEMNEVIRTSVARLVKAPDIGGVLDAWVIEAVRATGAAGGAVLRRVDTGTEFAFETVAQAGAITRENLAADFVASIREVSRRDPVGFFARLAQGEFVGITAEELGRWYPEAGEYHRQHGNVSVWNVPFRTDGVVAGYLGLAFTEPREPDRVTFETLQALALQACMTMELREKAEAAREAAVAREREGAAHERAAELAKVNEALRRSLDRPARGGDVDELLAAFLSEAVDASGAVFGAVFARDSATEFALRALVRQGEAALRPGSPPFEVFEAWHRRTSAQNPGRPILEKLREGSSFWTAGPDPAATDTGAADFYRSWPHQAVWTVPLMVRNAAVGYFSLARTDLQKPSATVEASVAALGTQIALVLELKRLGRDAERAVLLAERNRMAGEIHDTLAQGFTGISLQLQAALDGWEAWVQEPASARAGAFVQQRIQSAFRLARENLEEARRSIWALGPGALEGQNLAGAIEVLLQRLPEAQVSRITWQVRGPSRPLTPEAEGELLRIAQEALANAFGHAGPEARVRVSLRFKPDGVDLRVEDDGPGFPAALGKPDDGHNGHGQHYGLTSMRERATRIGANLRLENRRTGGARVAVHLPTQPEASRSFPGKARPPVAVPDADDGRRPVRVLVADDHRLVREGITAILGRSGKFDVVGEASDGGEAVRLYRRLRPDVVLIDLRMPGFDGVRATREILSFDPQARVVVLTTFESDDGIYEALRAGAKVCLPKHVGADGLAEAVLGVAEPGRSPLTAGGGR